MVDNGIETTDEVKLRILDGTEDGEEINIHQVHVPIHLKFNKLNVKSGEKTILQDVSGEFVPGEMVAIMGPSGAGKSTLLNFLGGRSKGMELESGKISINGQKSTKTMRRRIGYVLQEDVFFSHLTVDQTLKFVGDIRLPDKLTKQQKYKIVDEVMDELGLRKCADTVMGGDIFVTGCSGGEKKRCSIATELITNPSLLMMDEPTSGLDSSTAFNLIQTLKNLARSENRTIVTTIHQPSSHVFHMFDKLILICDGKVAYSGKTSEVLKFFEHLGTPCFPNWNPADFIIEQLSDDSALKSTIADKFLEYKRSSQSDEFEDVELKSSSSANGVANGVTSPESSPVERPKQKKMSTFKKAFLSKEEDDSQLPKWPTGFRTQFNALSKRSFIQSKNDMLDKLGFIQTLGLATIVSLLWFNTPYDEESLVDRQGAIFFVLVFLVLHPMFQSIFTFPTERNAIQKERAAGMYRLSAYYFAKLFSELPALLLHPFIMHVICYWATGLNRSPYFLVSLFAITTGAILAQSLGLVVGAAVKNFKRALTVAVIVGLGSMLLGGFYTKRVPPWMVWSRYVSHISYAFNILIRVEYQHATRPFTCATASAYEICKSNVTSQLTGADVLPNVKTIDLGIAESFAVLWSMIVFFRVLFYLVLKYLNKPV